MRLITTYDKNVVIPIEKAKTQKCFYEINDMKVSLIEGLAKIHFADKLYNDVQEGSKRWWVLERRKYDYNRFYSKNNCKRVTKDIICTHENEWQELVTNFYSYQENGYIVSEEIKTNNRIPSAYKLKKYFDGENILPKEEAKKIGYNENGIPLFFTVSRNDEGVDVDVNCNLNIGDISYGGGINCRRESLRWWIIERMRFDYGNPYRPLIEGQHKGDWRGVVNRFRYNNDGYIRLEPIDIIKEHQEAWERYIDARYNYLSKPILTKEQIDENNILQINSMSEDDIMLMCREAPDVIYKYIPSFYYGKIVCDCITKLKSTGRLYNSDEKKISALINIITKAAIIPNEKVAETISIKTVNECLKLYPNDYRIIILTIVINAIKSNLIDKQYQKTLFDIVRSISIKNVGENKVDNDQLKWFDVNDTTLHDAIYGREKTMHKFCSKFGLIIN